MGSLISASIKASELKKIDPNKIIKGQKDKYIPITISVDDISKYGKNVSITIQQTKEERDKKVERHFLGNGSVIWTDGNIVKGQKDEDQNNQQTPAPSSANGNDFGDDLPF
jgi:hypothetical protein